MSKLLRLGLVCIAIVLFSNLLLAQTISFQGVLLENDEPVADGQYTITFRLYEAATGGTSIWMEQQNVTTANGVYHVELGSIIAFDDVEFDTSYWLSVQVGSEAEMSRLSLTYSPYAIHANRAAIATDAEQLGGTSADSFTKGVNYYYVTVDELTINSEWPDIAYVELTVDEPTLLVCNAHFFQDGDGPTAMQILLGDTNGSYIDLGAESFANPTTFSNRNHSDWVFPVEAGTYRVILSVFLQETPQVIDRIFLSVTTIHGEDQTETMLNSELGGHPNADPNRPLSPTNR